MAKKSRSKRRPYSPRTGSVHDRIQAEAQQAREAPILSLRDAAETPELAALLESALKAAGAAVPMKFIHEGRPYWLRVSIGMARYEVFDSPATALPLVAALCGSADTFGHTPGH